MFSENTLSQANTDRIKQDLAFLKANPEQREKFLGWNIIQSRIKAWRLYRSTTKMNVFRVNHAYYGTIFFLNIEDVLDHFRDELESMGIEGEECSIWVELVKMTGREYGQLPVFEY